MGENMDQGYKMAITMVIMCFIISLGLTVTMVSTHAWDQVEYDTTVSIVNTQSMTAFQLAKLNKPVPVAAVWKVMNELDPNCNQCTTVAIYDKAGNLVHGGTSRRLGIAAGVTQITKEQVDRARADIGAFLEHKGYFSYALNEANMYDIIINLTD